MGHRRTQHENLMGLRIMAELTPTALVVLQELAAKGPMTPLEIREQMGLPSRTISTALHRLTEKRLCLKIPNLLDMRQSLYAVDPVRMKEMQIDFYVNRTAIGSRMKVL
ncbi:MAG: ArsR family transcriptional regulator [Candidatus Thorarchaeota archaeon]|nr:ArsR family transcriptional regulator [Candidatus Thorarchaeota archaeon]